MSSLRTSAVRSRRPPAIVVGSGRATAPRWKTSPSIAARSITERHSPSSESIRAWSRAWIVGGTATSRVAVLAHHREHLLDEERVPARCRR